MSSIRCLACCHDSPAQTRLTNGPSRCARLRHQTRESSSTKNQAGLGPPSRLSHLHHLILVVEPIQRFRSTDRSQPPGRFLQNKSIVESVTPQLPSQTNSTSLSHDRCNPIKLTSSHPPCSTYHPTPKTLTPTPYIRSDVSLSEPTSKWKPFSDPENSVNESWKLHGTS